MKTLDNVISTETDYLTDSSSKWESYRFKEIVNIKGGQTPSTKDSSNWNGTIPWITPKDVTSGTTIYVSETSRYITEKGLGSKNRLHPPGSVLLTSRAPVGEAVINSVPMATNQGFIGIECSKFVDNKYLYYWIKNNQILLNQNASGTTFREISKSVFKELVILLPPIYEQKIFSDILFALDSKIELKHQMNLTLESLARALFHSWFVRFDPFQEGEFVESELGKIPKGWKIFNLDEVIEINPKRELEKGSKYKKVGMADINPNKLSIEKYTYEYYKGGGSKFQNGDTLFARITPCLENGKTAFVDFLEETELGFGSTEFIVLSYKMKVGAYFIYCLSRIEEFRDYAISLMTGTSGRQRVQTDGLKSWKIPLPESNEIIDNYENIVGNLFKKIKHNSREILFLSSLRDLLLPQLLSGKLRIKDPEQFLEELEQ